MKGKALDETTPLKIKAAAVEVFLANGYDGATMQAIADKAGVNKAQLHYYYRNKDSLFLLIFKEELQSLIHANLPLIMSKETTARAKLEAWIDSEADFLAQFPKLPLFVISEMQRNPELIQGFLKEMRIPEVTGQLMGLNRELEEAGRKVSIEELLTMIYSLLLFPVLSAPLVSFLLDLKPKRWLAVQARQAEFAKELLGIYLA